MAQVSLVVRGRRTQERASAIMSGVLAADTTDDSDSDDSDSDVDVMAACTRRFGHSEMVRRGSDRWCHVVITTEKGIDQVIMELQNDGGRRLEVDQDGAKELDGVSGGPSLLRTDDSIDHVHRRRLAQNSGVNSSCVFAPCPSVAKSVGATLTCVGDAQRDAYLGCQNGNGNGNANANETEERKWPTLIGGNGNGIQHLIMQIQELHIL
eukprot:366512-Chlamydomonas_euryale.AAC.7